jgi:hypothetical protein
MSDANSSVSKLYRTSDVYFSAFLCSLDIPLKTTESGKSTDGNKKVVFVFSVADIDLNKAKSLYFGGSGTVKARVFVDHVRSLKSMCFV